MVASKYSTMIIMGIMFRNAGILEFHVLLKAVMSRRY